ncbi:hypothetical protein JTE90_011371 [Oedothorax gibbosus]|uniref:Uncharacterized protein n=1 Tax=Oedothorax gibbosus TaxID=931172 RepID=A0AAV6VNW5_9ARAC|nr:hypothetical protein JTE90_011371 [Oedothorax gibbosus]
MRLKFFTHHPNFVSKGLGFFADPDSWLEDALFLGVVDKHGWTSTGHLEFPLEGPGSFNLEKRGGYYYNKTQLIRNLNASICSIH